MAWAKSRTCTQNDYSFVFFLHKQITTVDSLDKRRNWVVGGPSKVRIWQHPLNFNIKAPWRTPNKTFGKNLWTAHSRILSIHAWFPDFVSGQVPSHKRLTVLRYINSRPRKTVFCLASRYGNPFTPKSDLHLTSAYQITGFYDWLEFEKRSLRKEVYCNSKMIKFDVGALKFSAPLNRKLLWVSHNEKTSVTSKLKRMSFPPSNCHSVKSNSRKNFMLSLTFKMLLFYTHLLLIYIYTAFPRISAHVIISAHPSISHNVKQTPPSNERLSPPPPSLS